MRDPTANSRFHWAISVRPFGALEQWAFQDAARLCRTASSRLAESEEAGRSRPNCGGTRATNLQGSVHPRVPHLPSRAPFASNRPDESNAQGQHSAGEEQHPDIG